MARMDLASQGKALLVMRTVLIEYENNLAFLDHSNKYKFNYKFDKSYMQINDRRRMLPIFHGVLAAA